MPNHEKELPEIESKIERSASELLAGLLGEINDLESLSPSEISYAVIEPYLPPDKGLALVSLPSPSRKAPASTGAQFFDGAE